MTDLEQMMKTSQDTIRGLLNAVEILSIERQLARDRIQDLLIANNQFEARARGAERKLKEVEKCTTKFMKEVEERKYMYITKPWINQVLEELLAANRGGNSSSATSTTSPQPPSANVLVLTDTQSETSSTETGQ